MLAAAALCAAALGCAAGARLLSGKRGWGSLGIVWGPSLTPKDPPGPATPRLCGWEGRDALSRHGQGCCRLAVVQGEVGFGRSRGLFQLFRLIFPGALARGARWSRIPSEE